MKSPPPPPPPPIYHPLSRISDYCASVVEFNFDGMVLFVDCPIVKIDISCLKTKHKDFILKDC